MNQQQDHVVWIHDWNLEESNNRIHPRTTRATRNLVSDKLQRCWKSACLWIQRSNEVASRNLVSNKLQRSNEVFFWICVIQLWLDPLFCYSLVINDEKKCPGVDKKLGSIAIVLRSVMDLLCVIHVISQFCTGFSLPRASERAVVLLPAWAIKTRLLTDILSVLPLPQVMLLIIISQVGFFNATKSLTLVVVFQYVPRVLRIYPSFITFRRNSGLIMESAWSKAAFNLFLYMLASHIVGAFWYSFAVGRKTMCWEEACKNRIGCVRLSCDDILRNYTFLTDSCPIKTPNATIFDFGIFLEALDSGIVDSTDFLRKFSSSFWFGLQSLSSLGQNLKTSSYFWEIVFAVIITIFGLVLFAFLIGNMQTYLQAKTARLEEMRLKGREIDQWMAFHSLPPDLKERIRKYQQYKWRETRGVDVEKLLYNLPRNLRRDVKRHLCRDLLMRVPMFEMMDEQLLDAMCERLNPVLYTEGSYIVREGDPVDEMHFIMRGKLLSMTTDGGTTGFFNCVTLKVGDFCGEELVTWALDPHSSYLPTSTRTVKALTDVEAYALVAVDLKFVGSQFRRFHSRRLQHTFRFYSQQWRTWAACFIQATWRRYCKKKLEESLRASGSSPSLGATIYASRFAANALRAIRRNGTRKARVPDRVPPVLLEKPAEHC